MVGIDGSTGSDVAFRTAVDLARLCEGVVYGVAVVPEVGSDSTGPSLAVQRDPQAAAEVKEFGTSWFTEALDACEGSCATAQVEFARNLLSGDPGRVLVEQAEGCDMVVVGAHGRDDDPHTLLGHTARRVLRSCIKPILVTRGPYKPFKRALVGYDGTADSGHAVEWVADFAAPGGWQVWLITGTYPQSELADGARRAAGIIMSRGVKPEVGIHLGGAPDILFEQAEKYDVDLIAIGSAPKGPVTGFFIGEAWPDIVEQARTCVLCWR